VPQGIVEIFANDLVTSARRNDFREDFALMKPRFNAARVLMGQTQPSRRANNPPPETRGARAFSLSLSLSSS